jgi:hypothetical protein
LCFISVNIKSNPKVRQLSGFSGIYKLSVAAFILLLFGLPATGCRQLATVSYLWPNHSPMKKIISFLIIAGLSAFAFFSFTTGETQKVRSSDNDSTVIAKIFQEAYAGSGAYDALRGLCEKAPRRLSGSAGAQVAVEYMAQVMRDAKFDKVWLQPCIT